MGERRNKSESALMLATALMEFNIDAAYRRGHAAGLREGRRESNSADLAELLEEMEAASLKLDAMRKKIGDIFGEAG